MNLSLAMVTTDSTDPLASARWWAEAIGAEIAHEMDGFAALSLPGGTMLGFQQVDEPTPGKNRLHYDFSAADPEAEAQRLEGLGATRQGRHGDDSFWWITLADPDGLLFDVAPSHD